MHEKETEQLRPIHLIGSNGFIGKAIQRQAGEIPLLCWSHCSSRPENSFDLLNTSSWVNLLRCKPETVILLSWPGVTDFHNSFHITEYLPATVKLIEELISAGLKHIVISGTCHEYGPQLGAMQEYQFTNPVTNYAIAKDTARRAISILCDQNEVSWCWLRIFFTYGEGTNPKSFLQSLEQAIQAGDATFPMSSGHQLRDFIAIDDVADHLLLLATHQKAAGIYNGG
jgi:dTDP-6-deoxy-L-talose 4-dehydrogenase (NAD+)